MKRIPTLTLFFAAFGLIVHASPTLTLVFEFDRTAIIRGEFWRLVTGHFTHFGADHLRWDVIAFIAFGSLVELRSRKRFLVCVGLAALGVSVGVGLFQPQFLNYRGLSGLDSALFGFVTADLLRAGWRERDHLAMGFTSLALAGFLAKSAYEISTGLTLFVAPSADFKSVPLAHLLGAVAGTLSALFKAERPAKKGARSTSHQHAHERISGHAAE